MLERTGRAAPCVRRLGSRPTGHDAFAPSAPAGSQDSQSLPAARCYRSTWMHFGQVKRPRSGECQRHSYRGHCAPCNAVPAPDHADTPRPDLGAIVRPVLHPPEPLVAQSSTGSGRPRSRDAVSVLVVRLGSSTASTLGKPPSRTSNPPMRGAGIGVEQVAPQLGMLGIAPAGFVRFDVGQRAETEGPGDGLVGPDRASHFALRAARGARSASWRPDRCRRGHRRVHFVRPCGRRRRYAPNPVPIIVPIDPGATTGCVVKRACAADRAESQHSCGSQMDPRGLVGCRETTSRRKR